METSSTGESQLGINELSTTLQGVSGAGWRQHPLVRTPASFVAHLLLPGSGSLPPRRLCFPARHCCSCNCLHTQPPRRLALCRSQEVQRYLQRQEVRGLPGGLFHGAADSPYLSCHPLPPSRPALSPACRSPLPRLAPLALPFAGPHWPSLLPAACLAKPRSDSTPPLSCCAPLGCCKHVHFTGNSCAGEGWKNAGFTTGAACTVRRQAARRLIALWAVVDVQTGPQQLWLQTCGLQLGGKQMQKFGARATE